MATLIPYDQSKADALHEQMSKTLFRDVDSFIQLYNSGIITRNHKDNKRIAELIVDTFKDVEDRRNHLGFISEEEIIIKETTSLLNTWALLSRIKRQFSEAVTAGSVEDDETLVIDDEGIVSRVVIDETTGEEALESVSDVDKVFTRSQVSFEIVRDYFKEYGDTDSTVNVPVSVATTLDTSFVKSFKDIAPAE